MYSSSFCVDASQLAKTKTAAVIGVQASPPPYNLPEECAERAQHIFNDMLRAGIHPEDWHFHVLMDCQASAAHMLQLFTWHQGTKRILPAADSQKLQPACNWRQGR